MSKKIKAADARIFWATNPDKIAILEDGKVHPLNVDQLRDMPFSGGACYSDWKSLCSNELSSQVNILKYYRDLVMNYKMNPKVVHEGFSCIKEYCSI